jgi:hypothetical protein
MVGCDVVLRTISLALLRSSEQIMEICNDLVSTVRIQPSGYMYIFAWGFRMYYDFV